MQQDIQFNDRVEADLVDLDEARIDEVAGGAIPAAA